MHTVRILCTSEIWVTLRTMYDTTTYCTAVTLLCSPPPLIVYVASRDPFSLIYTKQGAKAGCFCNDVEAEPALFRVR